MAPHMIKTSMKRTAGTAALAALLLGLTGTASALEPASSLAHEAGSADLNLKSKGTAAVLELLPPLLLIGGGLGMVELGSGRGEAHQDIDELVGSGIALTALGLAIGPAGGHLYTGEGSKGLLFTLGRSAGLGLGTWGFFIMVENTFHCFMGCTVEEDQAGPPPPAALGAAMIGVGALGWLGLTIWEVIDVNGSIDRHNARLQEGLRSVSVAPLLLRSPRTTDHKTSQDLATGLQLTLTF